MTGKVTQAFRELTTDAMLSINLFKLPSRLICSSPLTSTLAIDDPLSSYDFPCPLMGTSPNSFVYGTTMLICVPSAIMSIYLMCFLNLVYLCLFQLYFTQ